MQQIFVELYKYRGEWAQEAESLRSQRMAEFAEKVEGASGGGIEFLGSGKNDPGMPKRAPYDFFFVYRAASVEARRAFQKQIASSPWYPFFDCANVGGDALTAIGLSVQIAACAPATNPGRTIAPDSPFTKKDVIVYGHRMAYVDEGEGLPILFIHGDIASSFLWRNVIPHLADASRCIAVDLIGAGDSEKLPESGPHSYLFAEHARFLSGFIDALDIPQPLVLVGHDWGANLAFEWAMAHPGHVAGLAFCEPLLPPFEWSDWPEYVRGLFQFIRSDAGEQAIMVDNAFATGSARSGHLRMLSSDERTAIEGPYAGGGEAARPTLSWPREVPFGDDRSAARDRIEAHAGWLAWNEIPKLHVRGRPGAMMFGRREEPLAGWVSMKQADVKGLHWPPEDDPHGVGEALRDWVSTL